MTVGAFAPPVEDDAGSAALVLYATDPETDGDSLLRLVRNGSGVSIRF